MKNKLKMSVKLAAVLTGVSMVFGNLTALAADNDVQNAALDYLNDVRAHMGIPLMELDPSLTSAAGNHANYLLVNQENGHTEAPNKQGFSGKLPWDRAAAAGLDTDKYGVFEDVSFTTDSPEVGVQSLLDAPLHRASLILPDMSLLGVGYNKHALVLNPAKKWFTYAGTGVYPYDGQRGVPIGFYGFEIPNPLEQFNLEKSGYFITYAGVAQEKSDVTASMIDSQGVSVEIYKLKQELGDTNAWHIIPKQELAYGQTYTVTVEQTTWSFTTVENPAKPSTTEQKGNPVKTDPPKKFTQNDVGIRVNGTYIDVSPKAKIIGESTFIPLRGVFEAMGAKVIWEGTRQQVTIVKGSKTIVLNIGNKQALVNGTGQALSNAPFISAEGSTYVPLRFATEALGAQVAWESDKWTAVINQMD
ncbi:stalk domain-containing protein [Paenibacillus oryzisoli]|uniref:stalk domain-containing protein n=1 Tax=Paenibacillus oryzisoli TaxID=1850517 RepID=UPI0009EE8429|nr:stalk domain-containing protein [Paenibacillus oryzisoli]